MKCVTARFLQLPIPIVRNPLNEGVVAYEIHPLSVGHNRFWYLNLRVSEPYGLTVCEPQFQRIRRIKEFYRQFIPDSAWLLRPGRRQHERKHSCCNDSSQLGFSFSFSISTLYRHCGEGRKSFPRAQSHPGIR